MEAVAARADSTAVYLSQVRNQQIDAKTKKPREMGTKMARRLEKAFDKPTGWMDQDHTDAAVDRSTRDRIVGEALRTLTEHGSRTSIELLKFDLARTKNLLEEDRARYSAAIESLENDAKRPPSKNAH